MKGKRNLPLNFKIGQQVEAKSFEEGYRGAWFRCKIKDCSKKCSEPTVALDYLDFNDYKNYWINLYEKNQSPVGKPGESKERHLMLRPIYPQIYNQSQMSNVCEISGTVGIVDGTWEVGDLVDWFRNGCYWSARITKLLDEKNVEIQLPEPPMGEGETYKALCKDLRPSLDWSPKLGWTLPVFEVGKDLRRCVRLIHSNSPIEVRKNAVGSSETSSYVLSHTSAGLVHQELPVDSSGMENLKKASSLAEPPELSAHSLEREILEKYSGNLLNAQKTDTSSINNDVAEKACWSDSVSSHGDNYETVLARKKTASREDLSDSSGSLVKMRKGKTELNSTSSDTIDSSIMGLQELVYRVRWLKGVLNHKSDYSNTVKPPWRYSENQVSLTDQLSASDE
ncbi:hypothetical protein MKW94_015962 [Papaver nudicaule]|uniref:Agenet domain-containing protein n=1 Tax=Papaver nudicaule TaxID=74823 RepID=A0AA41SIA0_PAPNU|nr:hypothetical protein [Papaver nudicaule]